MDLKSFIRLCNVIPCILRIGSAAIKEHTTKTIHNAIAQAKHPGLRCHFSCEIIIHGRLTVKGRVFVGKRTRIIIPKGCHLVLQGENDILNDVLISPSKMLIIGRGASIQDGCILLGNVEIGSYCLLAPRVFASSGQHAFKGNGRLPPWAMIKLQDACQPSKECPIRIDSDCWIGVNTTILPGYRLARGSIVGAGSVLRGECKTPYSILVGAPAKCIGRRWTDSSRQLEQVDAS